MVSTSRILEALVLTLAASSALANGNGTTEVASVGPGGVAANSPCFLWTQAWSADGRYVVFWSSADNLDPSDTYVGHDCFIHDRLSGTTTILNLAPDGSQGTGGSYTPVITPDGRFAAFTSGSTELVPTNNNSFDDAFVRDLSLGTVVRVSDGVGGVPGNGASGATSISADGLSIAFGSLATNLVSNDTNGSQDIFVHDLVTATTTRVSVSSSGAEANGECALASISADGRYVAFESRATNLGGSTFTFTEVMVHDRLTGQTFPATVHHATGQPVFEGGEQPALSADGRYIAFESFSPDLVPGDVNGDIDIFVRDLWNGVTVLASVASSGAQANNHCHDPSISADGRHVAFWSSATNLVPGDVNNHRDIFVRDLKLGTTALVSVSTAGVQSNGMNLRPVLSPDGSLIAFESFADSLVPGIGNGLQQIYVRTCPPAGPETYCPAQPNSLGCQAAIAGLGTPSASAGSGFQVSATNLANSKLGLLVYSKTSAALNPFGGHFLCVQPPLRRTPIQNSGGTPPPGADCTGVLDLDFNAWAASGKDPALVSGQTVWAQYWSRDPQAPSTTNLSDALTFVLGN